MFQLSDEAYLKLSALREEGQVDQLDIVLVARSNEEGLVFELFDVDPEEIAEMHQEVFTSSGLVNIFVPAVQSTIFESVKLGFNVDQGVFFFSKAE